MIPKNELRIGNWINTGEFHISGQQGNYQMETDWFPYADMFHPIPLTPEVLLAVGFDKLNGARNVYKIKANGIEISVNTRLEFVYIETDFGHARVNNLPYPNLHQLQNIVQSLTGQELNYTP